MIGLGCFLSSYSCLAIVTVSLGGLVVSSVTLVVSLAFVVAGFVVVDLVSKFPAFVFTDNLDVSGRGEGYSD